MEQDDGASVPSPIDHTGTQYWVDRGAQEAESWSGLFTHVLCPPLLEGASLGGGYDPKNHYSMKSRFAADRRSVQRFAAICNRNDIDILVDAVLAHMDGGDSNGYEYHFNTPWGVPYRFQKDRTCFVGPHVAKDNVLAPNGDFAYLFGRQLGHQNGYYGTGTGLNKRGYIMRNMMDALKWYTDALDAQGIRIDNLKSMAASVIYYYMTNFVRPMWAVGEYYDGNDATLDWVLFNSGINGKISCFDFNLYFWLRDLCNSFGKTDMRGLRNAGLIRTASMNAVPFAENHDTDTGGNPIIWNKETAECVINTSEGVPSIYYKDYTADGGYGLGKICINNLLWQRYWFGNGPTIFRDDGNDFSIYERLDWPGWLIGINTSGQAKDINIPTAFGPNVHLHDYTGHSWDTWTDNQGRVTLHLPAGMKNFVTYSRDGYQGKTIPINERAAVQYFEGAEDLDIGPAIEAGRETMQLWCDADKPITLNKIHGDNVTFQLKDATGNEIIPKGNWNGHTKQKGWHTLTAYAPTETKYKIECTYWAPKGL
jgi:alpha-amylase